MMGWMERMAAICDELKLFWVKYSDGVKIWVDVALGCKLE